MRKRFINAQIDRVLRGGHREVIIPDTSGEIDDDTHATHAGKLLSGRFAIGKPRKVNPGERCTILFYLERSPEEYDVLIGECDEEFATFKGTKISRQH